MAAWLAGRGTRPRGRGGGGGRGVYEGLGGERAAQAALRLPPVPTLAPASPVSALQYERYQPAYERILNEELPDASDPPGGWGRGRAGRGGAGWGGVVAVVVWCGWGGSGRACSGPRGRARVQVKACSTVHTGQLGERSSGEQAARCSVATPAAPRALPPPARCCSPDPTPIPNPLPPPNRPAPPPFPQPLSLAPPPPRRPLLEVRRGAGRQRQPLRKAHGDVWAAQARGGGPAQRGGRRGCGEPLAGGCGDRRRVAAVSGGGLLAAGALWGGGGGGRWRESRGCSRGCGVGVEAAAGAGAQGTTHGGWRSGSSPRGAPPIVVPLARPSLPVQPPHRACCLHDRTPGVPTHQHAHAGGVPRFTLFYSVSPQAGQRVCHRRCTDSAHDPPMPPPPSPAADHRVIWRGRRAGAGRGAAHDTRHLWGGGRQDGGGGGGGAG